MSNYGNYQDVIRLKSCLLCGIPESAHHEQSPYWIVHDFKPCPLEPPESLSIEGMTLGQLKEILRAEIDGSLRAWITKKI